MNRLYFNMSKIKDITTSLNTMNQTIVNEQYTFEEEIDIIIKMIAIMGWSLATIRITTFFH